MICIDKVWMWSTTHHWNWCSGPQYQGHPIPPLPHYHTGEPTAMTNHPRQCRGDCNHLLQIPIYSLQGMPWSEGKPPLSLTNATSNHSQTCYNPNRWTTPPVHDLLFLPLLCIYYSNPPVVIPYMYCSLLHTLPDTVHPLLSHVLCLSLRSHPHYHTPP